MQQEFDGFVAFEDLSDDDYEVLFGTNKREAVDAAYRDQKYQVQRSAGVNHTVVLKNSPRAHHPYAAAILPAGWIASGGGAQANWSTQGSLLTMCKPYRSGATHGWQAQSKDHVNAEEVVLSVWAVGLKFT